MILGTMVTDYCHWEWGLVTSFTVMVDWVTTYSLAELTRRFRRPQLGVLSWINWMNWYISSRRAQRERFFIMISSSPITLAFVTRSHSGVQSMTSLWKDHIHTGLSIESGQVMQGWYAYWHSWLVSFDLSNQPFYHCPTSTTLCNLSIIKGLHGMFSKSGWGASNWPWWRSGYELKGAKKRNLRT